MIIKKNSLYKSISEVTKILNLVNQKNGKLSTHTVRFWEKQFKQVKPKILAGNRRYYDQKTIEILKKIKYLLKTEGMTIVGAKKQLNLSESNIDEIKNSSITNREFKSKIKRISTIIKEIKNG